jgi:hypothetical protein
MSQTLLTPEMLAAFQAKGGQVKRLNTMSPVTGQIRFHMSAKRRELEEQGVPIDEMPHWCLTYEEKKARRLLPHQIRADQRKKGK